MIRSKCCLKVPFLASFSMHTKKKRFGQIRLTPCYSLSQVVSICQSFRPLTPFFFLTKVPFLAFFLEYRKVWPYRHAYDVPLVTLILNIYGFVGLASFFFSGKCTIFAFF